MALITPEGVRRRRRRRHHAALLQEAGRRLRLQAGSGWVGISISTSGVHQWTASGSGTDEYYLEAAGGGDFGLAEPSSVFERGNVELGAGTAGSLTAGQWDYADNDTLGFSTVYVRLSDGADPDSKSNGQVRYLA